jgi:hypothetical protein
MSVVAETFTCDGCVDQVRSVARRDAEKVWLTVVFPGQPGDPKHFHSFGCLADWAEGMAELWAAGEAQQRAAAKQAAESLGRARMAEPVMGVVPPEELLPPPHETPDADLDEDVT